VRDLVGVEVDVSGLPEVPAFNGLSAIGAATVSFSERDLEAFEGLADETAGAIFSDAGRRGALVQCDLEADGCLASFIARFGRRAFRRTLTEQQKARLVALAEDSLALVEDPSTAGRFVLSAILQSPRFLYRSELGVSDRDHPGSRSLDGYELASRLSFLLWNSIPDEALLDAAEKGELASAEGLAKQARRLLAAPRAREALGAFYASYLGLDGLERLDKLSEAFPQMSPSLGAAMGEQTLRTMLAATLDEERDFRALFTTRRTFLNPELAALYGVPAPSAKGYAPYEFAADSPRAGLLTHASVLALHAHPTASSPTLRGKFIRESLLCQAVPPPPPSVNTELPEASTTATARERLTQHREDPACAGCHAITDPPGLALENFDGIGVYREREHGSEIDPSGELDGVAFADAAGLGEVLAQHPNLVPCFARVLLRHARGVLEGKAERQAVDELVAQFAAAGYRVRELLVALVQSEAFRRVGELASGGGLP
jgi:hypothetical protein